MDPDETWKDMLNALELEDWERVVETASALLRWPANGGYPPITLGSRALGHEWHNKIAKDFAITVLGKALRMKRELKRQMNRKSGKRSKHQP